MIERSDIVWLGVSSAVAGALVAGLMLGIGLAMAVTGHLAGLLLIVPGTPVAGLIGLVLSRRVAGKLK